MSDQFATAYPLQWPDGWPRTAIGRRQYSPFKQTFTSARDGLLAELSRLGAKQPVISSDLMLRQDGLPLARQRNPDDVGVAVYFTYKDKQMVFACDKYRNITENMHAIRLSIEAIRGLERWGASDMMERAFTGFQAIPDQSGDAWRDVLAAHGIEDINVVRTNYQRLRALHHPDKGGDGTKFDLVQKAWNQAQQELGAPA